ncbi:MAG TPA: hypothetical protein VF622_00980 [Segetibacter sp.]|jgi:hypothetical protein
MKTASQLLIVALILSLPFSVFSQNDTSTPRTNVFTAGVNYQSRLHYFGRTDSLESKGMFGSIGYELKQGFYTNANFIFVNNASTSFDYTGSVIEAGYKFPASRNFSGNIAYSHFLYKESSQLVQSSVKSQAEINLAYNNKIVNVNAGADAKFSDKTDFGLTAGLDRLFIYLIPGTSNAIAINPSFYTYAGSQSFTQTYYEKKKKVNVLGLPIGNGNGNQNGELVSEEVKRFTVLAHEFSLPVVFVAGKFNASFTGSYVMPQNLVTVANRPDLTENGRNMFYFTAGIGVRL